jgi:hypothetical protein
MPIAGIGTRGRGVNLARTMITTRNSYALVGPIKPVTRAFALE